MTQGQQFVAFVVYALVFSGFLGWRLWRRGYFRWLMTGRYDPRDES